MILSYHYLPAIESEIPVSVCTYVCICVINHAQSEHTRATIRIEISTQLVD